MLPPAVRSWRDLIPLRGSTICVPDFLIPSISNSRLTRPFSTTLRCASRVGGAVRALPPGVELRVLEPLNRKVQETRIAPRATIEIEGPLGKMSLQIPQYMHVIHDEKQRRVTLKVQDPKARKQREMWGTMGGYLQNHILGVSEGHTAILRLVGVGYRATIEPTATTVKEEYPGQQYVSLKVGYSHPIELGIPLGMKASTPQPTRILLEGIEKEAVHSFAANIRKWRKPEPYKGKGIFVNGETIKLKAKKIK